MISYFFTLVLSVVAVTAQPGLIEWSPSRKLSWQDFKAAPDGASSNAALTSSSINVEFGYDDNELNFTIKCRFDKSKSWVRVRNAGILAHEQGHFDIAEIHARKLNKALKAYRFNPKTVSEDVNTIYDSIMSEHHQAQNEYDRDTDFSRNKEQQAVWLKRVAENLQQLRSFAGYGSKTTTR
jgi:hypothetical protein